LSHPLEAAACTHYPTPLSFVFAFYYTLVTLPISRCQLALAAAR